MTPEQFAYWLQGFAEIHNSTPNTQEWQVIKDHLATVFKKVTPSYPIGPGVAAPATEPIKPYNPYPGVYTTPLNWPRPEIICSVDTVNAPGAGFDWVSGAGSFAIASKIEDLK